MSGEPTREQLAAAMAANAARKPLNLAVAVVAFLVALVAGAPALVAVLIGVVLYTAAVGRTLFDADEAERVAARQQGDGSA